MFNGEVQSVNIPAIAGELSIMSGSLPTITELNAGVVSVQGVDGESSEYFVSPGFALKSKENSLTISVAEAFPVADLDPDAVEQVGVFFFFVFFSLSFSGSEHICEKKKKKKKCCVGVFECGSISW